MRYTPIAVALLLVLAAALPFAVAAGSAPAPDAPVILATGVVEVKDQAMSIQALFTAPEDATWATIRNDCPHLLLLGTHGRMTAGNSWTLSPGEEITFSLTSAVYLSATTGSVRMRVLVGR